ncbi:MAG: Hsp20/alpha crystallin family protein [Patescibacteria group bacterium]|nr:Hsp20/alpha crystallin family protein [Patescibacteria group bacterium]
MPKTKRSFIQRLIGKNSDANEEHEINYGTNYTNEPGQAQPRGMGGDINLGGTDPGPAAQQAAAQYAAPSGGQQQPINIQQTDESGRSDNDWVADQEGQLTIDVYQTETDIVIKSTIAGVKPEDLDVQINNDMVTIKGERKNDLEVRDEDYYYQECYWGAFSRSIILPVDVQANKSEATMKNGILTIKLPKSDSAQSRKIQVRGY